MYKFMFAGEYLQNVEYFRTLWPNGRYGSGKTLLSFATAYELTRRGAFDRIISNIDSEWFKTNITKGIEEEIRDCCIVLDEAWIFLESWRSVKSYAGFLRKFNLGLVMPSIFPVHARLRSLSVQRVFNFYGLGIPAWLFQWRLRCGFVRDKGHFILWNPAWFFNKYDTLAIPWEDGGIVAQLNKQSKDPDILKSKEPEVIDQDGSEDAMLTLADALEDQQERRRR